MKSSVTERALLGNGARYINAALDVEIAANVQAEMHAIEERVRASRWPLQCWAWGCDTFLRFARPSNFKFPSGRYCQKCYYLQNLIMARP
mgnify:CR=1 FL=1